MLLVRFRQLSRCPGVSTTSIFTSHHSFFSFSTFAKDRQLVQAKRVSLLLGSALSPSFRSRSLLEHLSKSRSFPFLSFILKTTMAQAASTRHQPSPLSPYPNRGRKCAPHALHTPSSIYPVSSIHLSLLSDFPVVFILGLHVS